MTQKAIPVGSSVVKWTKIELLNHVVRHLEERRLRLGEKFVYPHLRYRAKVKLDGTNAGIQLGRGGVLVAQSRSRLLTPADDNLGFAAWVEQNRDYFTALDLPHPHVILFGEWCGKGIQKRTAISEIDRRIFAVFALQYGDHHAAGEHPLLEVEPARLRAWLPPHPEIFVLPWLGEPIDFDFGDRTRLEAAAHAVEEQVLAVEQQDPWVREVFGIEGMGEGVVLYPMVEGLEDGPVPRDAITEMMFKAKGEKHQVVKQRSAAQLDPEVAKNIEAFVEMFATEARMEQALTEACGGDRDPKNIGAFLKWLSLDIKQESAVELEASGLEWKQVSKPLSRHAVSWFKRL